MVLSWFLGLHLPSLPKQARGREAASSLAPIQLPLELLLSVCILRRNGSFCQVSLRLGEEKERKVKKKGNQSAGYGAEILDSPQCRDPSHGGCVALRVTKSSSALFLSSDPQIPDLNSIAAGMYSGKPKKKGV